LLGWEVQPGKRYRAICTAEGRAVWVFQLTGRGCAAGRSAVMVLVVALGELKTSRRGWLGKVVSCLPWHRYNTDTTPLTTVSRGIPRYPTAHDTPTWQPTTRDSSNRAPSPCNSPVHHAHDQTVARLISRISASGSAHKMPDASMPPPWPARRFLSHAVLFFGYEKSNTVQMLWPRARHAR
jgi:hypothetical protein